MVVSKAEAESPQNVRIKKQIDWLCNFIDIGLMEGKREVRLGGLGIGEIALERVLQLYRQAGWEVEENFGDQREPGHWLSFR